MLPKAHPKNRYKNPWMNYMKPIGEKDPNQTIESNLANKTA